MQNERRTKAQLISELRNLQAKLKKLEKSETHLIRAEELLKKSEERYRLIFENSGEAILFAEPDGRILSANPEACRMFGRTEDEIKKVGRAKLVDPNDPRVEEIVKERRRTGASKGELNHVRKDGTIFPTEVSSYIFKDSSGKERSSVFIRDITVRKRAEVALREATQQLNAAQRIGKIGSWSWDQRTRKAIWSDGLFHIYGRSPEEGVPPLDRWLDNIHPDDREPLQQAIRDALDDDRPYSVDFRIKRYDNGQELTLHSDAVVERDANGAPLVMMGAVTDITERKKAEGLIEMLKRSIDVHPDGAYWMNRDDKFVYVNDSGCKALGYDREELIGRHLSSMNRRATDEAMRQVWERLRKDGFFTVESAHCRKDGSEFPVEIVSTYVRLNGQEFNCGFARDISERKRAEEALRESEERYRALVTLSPDAIYVHVDDRVALVNPAICRLLGAADPSQLIGMSVFDIVHPQYHEEVRERWELVFSGKPAPLLEEQFIRLDGAVVDVEVNAVSIDWKGGKGVQVIARDITERKRTLEALKESEERFRKAFRTSPDSININRLADGVFLDVNEGFTATTGYTREDVIGTSSVEKNLWRRAEDRSRLVQELRKSGHVKDFEAEFVLKDGRILAGLMSAALITLNNEQCILSTTKNITERKRAEADLRKALEWQEAIFEGSRDAIFISDEDSRFVAVNKAASDLTGYTRDQLLKMRIPDLHDHPDLDAYEKYHQRIFAGEEILSEAKVLRPDGGKIDTEFSNKCVSIDGKSYMHTTARDISERARAQERLKESEDTMRYMVKYDPNAVAIYDHNLNYVAVSDRYLKDYNVKEANVLGKHHYEVFPEMPQRWKTVHQRVLAGAIERNDDDYFVRPDGSITYSRWECRPWYRGDGTIGGMISYSEVTTERKKAELALQESEERHRSLFENMLEGYAHCKMIYENGVPVDFVYLDVNEAFEGLTGLKDVLGKKVSEVVPGIQHSDTELFQIYGRVALSGEPEKFEMFLESLRIWFSVAVYSSRKGHFVAIFDNISERKRMEESLRKERSMLSSIIETIPDEICLKDTDSRFIMANKASLTALGVTSLEQLIGKTDLDIIRPELALRHLAEEKSIITTGKAAISRERVRLDPETGEIQKCDLSTKVPVMEPDGNCVGLLVINRDITDRKLFEQRLRVSGERLRDLADHVQTVREEERKHIAQEFHDELGQTLTALKMDLSLLERGIADGKKKLSPNIIVQEMRSMHELIDHGIHAVREIMSELRPELLDQLGLVAALEWEVEKFQKRSGIQSRFVGSIGELQVDGTRSIALFRIVQEALTNVARHSQAASVEVNLQAQGDDLVLEINDNGIGITFDAENKARSFGLIGMRERAILLGGKLEITGNLGQGTKIAVRMPLHQTRPDGGANE